MAPTNESFVRWQSITIRQLGYVVGLILTFSTATLGFALAMVKGGNYEPGGWTKAFMFAALLFDIASLALGLWCEINRLRDFRRTRRIARDREKWKDDKVPDEEINRRLEVRRIEAEDIGEFTWILFHWQFGTFSVGVAALIVAFALAYHVKLF